MWQLSRIHLDRIGAPAALFHDVKIDMFDEFGMPLDTIAWLRNGGGKSTVLSLLCAQLRPKRTDFLAASSTSKHLEDYVGAGDPAHVRLEWADRAGRRLITGSFYEWEGQRVPDDPTKNHTRLNQAWYCLTPTEVMTTDDLPLTGAGGARLTFKEYEAALRALPAALGAVVCRAQDRWSTTLDRHGLDPELLSPILAMNATEGGIDAAFAFTGPEGFVRYLLSLVANPAAAETVSTTLGKLRDQLAKRPAVQTDHNFATEAVPLLHDLGTAYTDYQAAASAESAAVTSAGQLAGSLAAAADIAQRKTEQARAGEAEQRDRVRAARNARDIATTTAAELVRIAAVLGEKDAAAQAGAAEAEHTAAQAHLEALETVPQMASAQGQRTRVDELSRQMSATELGAAPLAGSRDAAAVSLAHALTRAVRDLDAATAARRATVAAATAARATAQDRQKEAAKQLTTLTLRTAELRRVEETYKATLRSAVAAGVLTVDDDPSVVGDRVQLRQAQLEQALTGVDATLVTVRAERLAARPQTRKLRDDAVAAHRVLAGAEQDEQQLADAVADIARRPEIDTLAQAAGVDVLAEASELLLQLRGRLHRLDQERKTLAVETAEDLRALDELENRELLPPAVDVLAALRVLTDAGIPATSGWRYLADNVELAQQKLVYQRLPALVAGIAVHEPARLGDAITQLASAQLRPTTAIAVGTTADLDRAQHDETLAQPLWLVPPAAALSDRAAAVTEKDLRQIAVDEAAERDRTLSADIARNNDLLLRLSDLSDRWSPADRERLSAATRTAQDAAARAQAAVEQAEHLEQQRENHERELTTERDTYQSERHTLASTAAKLADLVVRQTAADEAARELTRIPADQHQQREIEAAAAADVERLTQHLGDAQVDEANSARQRSELTSQLGALTSHDLSGPDDGVPLALARSRHAEAVLVYQQATSGSPLAAELKAAEQVLGHVLASLRAVPRERKEAASVLLERGLDPAEVESLAAVARSSVQQAERTLVSARTALQRAQDEVRTQTPDDRPRHRVLDGPEPTDRLIALRLAAEADQARATALADENTAAAAAAALSEEASTLAQRTKDLRALLPSLATAATAATATLPASTSPDAPSPFTGTEDAAAELAATARAALQETAAEERRLNGLLQHQTRRCFVFGNDERFNSVAADIRSRFRAVDVGAELAPVADSMADTMLAFGRSSAAHLVELDEHQKTVVIAMRGMVTGALKTLSRLETASKLPASLPLWEGRKFLEVGPRRSIDMAPAVLDDRIGRVVETLVGAGSEIPNGADLLWLATHAVVGDGGWRARILKPTVDGSIVMVAVPMMRKWSGGEKVTANLLLFALAVKVRALERGRDHVGFGVLPLDNPLGKASYVPFLELQRKVAGAFGIQLVFFTGVADLRAVGRFPNVVRLRNRAALLHRYVQVVGRDVDDADPVGLVDQVRVYRPDPIPEL